MYVRYMRRRVMICENRRLERPYRRNDLDSLLNGLILYQLESLTMVQQVNLQGYESLCMATGTVVTSIDGSTFGVVKG